MPRFEPFRTNNSAQKSFWRKL